MPVSIHCLNPRAPAQRALASLAAVVIVVAGVPAAGAASAPAWVAHSSGTTAGLHGADAGGGPALWAVGGGGTIVTAADGGATWSTRTSGTTKDLLDVSFPAAASGWAVGDTGTIVTTVDGGSTWQPQSSGVTVPLFSAHFVDGSTGWAVGGLGTIVATTDGGSTWNVRPSGTTSGLLGIDFVDAATGWAVGDGGTILATTDGGATWQSRPSGVTSTLHAVDFVDAATGWAVGDGGTILATTDGGATWQSRPSGVARSLLDVAFSDASSGWAVGGVTGGLGGGDPVIVATSDGGASWVEEEPNASSNLNAVAISDGGESVFAFGDSGTILARTEPSGGPAVSAVAPATGSALGGTTVTISGSGFTGATGVYFGSPDEANRAASFTVESDSRITAETRRHEAGAVDVVVVTPGGHSPGGAAARFTFVPGIDAVAPNASGPSGGVEVTITGAGFTEVTSVEFGNAGAGFTVVDDGTISAVAPAHKRGTVTVTVASPHGTSAGGSRSEFHYRKPAGRWRSTASPGVARWGHSATLLDDGRVLVAGGQDLDGNLVASAEIYDPRTESWTPAADMAYGRASHTATLLDDGRVLVAGGAGAGVDEFGDPVEVGVRKAETYDPVAGEWSPAGELAADHIGATATLLADGRVLVAGGFPFVADVELYDPAAGTWLACTPEAAGPGCPGPLEHDRGYHTATLLTQACGSLCGDILMLGGYGTGFGQSQNSGQAAEVYDPDAGSGTDVVDQPISRMHHSATRLPDGRVLVAGGRQASNVGLAPTHRSADLFDPAEPAATMWTPTGSLLQGRTGHTATLLPGGEVLAAGGLTCPANAAGPTLPVPTGELWDPTGRGGRGGWAFAGAMTHGRAPYADSCGFIGRGPSATLLSASTDSFSADDSVCGELCGRVLVVGGADPASAELFTRAPRIDSLKPRAGRWRGGTKVVVSGRGLLATTKVLFGGVRARRFTIASHRRMVAVAPRVRDDAEVTVTVIGDGGRARAPKEFTYTGVPGRVTDLVAKARSPRRIELRFSATGMFGNRDPAATEYVIKRSRSPITSVRAFRAATSVCRKPCSLSARTVGAGLTRTVGKLARGISYYFAVRARNTAGTLGPLSNRAKARTKS